MKSAGNELLRIVLAGFNKNIIVMAISKRLKHKIVVLTSVPLFFFGVSFEVISHPVFIEQTADTETEYISPEASVSENTQDSFFLRRNYVLPLERIQLPARKDGANDILIDAKSVLVIDESSGDALYKKDSDKKVRIASLTKLAAAAVMLDFIKTENSNLIIKAGNYNLDRTVEITKSAVEAEGDSGSLLVGEKIKAGELLKIMLIASSNDAARAIAEDITKKNNINEQGFGYFVELMNNFAKKENLTQTHFTNPDGIDEQDNYSTAEDVIKLSRSLLRNYPEIFAITRIDKINIKSEDGKIGHSIVNTDDLLGSLPGIVGGKTGYTDEAGESLLLAVEDSSRRHRIVAVVIGANGRFTQMEKLVNWVWDAYEWQ